MSDGPSTRTCEVCEIVDFPSSMPSVLTYPLVVDDLNDSGDTALEWALGEEGHTADLDDSPVARGDFCGHFGGIRCRGVVESEEMETATQHLKSRGFSNWLRAALIDWLNQAPVCESLAGPSACSCLTNFYPNTHTHSFPSYHHIMFGLPLSSSGHASYQVSRSIFTYSSFVSHVLVVRSHDDIICD